VCVGGGGGDMCADVLPRLALADDSRSLLCRHVMAQPVWDERCFGVCGSKVEVLQVRKCHDHLCSDTLVRHLNLGEDGADSSGGGGANRGWQRWWR
jgi:hypothetical protein